MLSRGHVLFVTWFWDEMVQNKGLLCFYLVVERISNLSGGSSSGSSSRRRCRHRPRHRHPRRHSNSIPSAFYSALAIR